jgi:hypothetical protein
MIHHPPILHAGKRLLLAGSLAILCANAWASPGAHGPNGEHLDVAPTAGATSSAPRIEARSESYELVGRLQGGELSMFINRFATNEPVDHAKVEVELGGLIATAPFHGDQGDYAVADEKFLEALGTKGTHALVITVVDGNASDLLEGSLEVGAAPASEAGHGHGRANSLLSVGLAVAALGAVGILGWLVGRNSRSRSTTAQGGSR